MAQLHDAAVIHFDVKPSHVLVDIESTSSELRALKLCDWSFARFSKAFPLVNADTAFCGGDLNFRPLEALLHSEILDCKVDVWAAACTAYQVAAGTSKPIFGGVDEEEVMLQIFSQLGDPSRDEMTFFQMLPKGRFLDEFFTELRLDEFSSRVLQGKLWNSASCAAISLDPGFARRVFSHVPDARPSAADCAARLEGNDVVSASPHYAFAGRTLQSPAPPLVVDCLEPTRGPILHRDAAGHGVHGGERGPFAVCYGRLPQETMQYLDEDAFLHLSGPALARLGLQSWELTAEMQGASEEDLGVKRALEAQCRGDVGHKIQMS